MNVNEPPELEPPSFSQRNYQLGILDVLTQRCHFMPVSGEESVLEIKYFIADQYLCDMMDQNNVHIILNGHVLDQDKRIGDVLQLSPHSKGGGQPAMLNVRFSGRAARAVVCPQRPSTAPTTPYGLSVTSQNSESSQGPRRASRQSSAASTRSSGNRFSVSATRPRMSPSGGHRRVRLKAADPMDHPVIQPSWMGPDQAPGGGISLFPYSATVFPRKKDKFPPHWR